MARKISKKLNKSQKQLLLGLLIGDGTITNHPDFKMDHSGDQEEYLRWKMSLLDQEKIKHTDIKEYTQKVGYGVGGRVVRLRISTNNTIKAIRRSIYTPKKTITKEWLKWFTPREIAIWYMDDGSINVNDSVHRSSIQYTMSISTCVDYETAQMIISYFQQQWGIAFRPFPERPGMYSIATRAKEDCFKFARLVKPYVEQVPSLLYKIRDKFTKKEFLEYQKTDAFRSARHIIGD